MKSKYDRVATSTLKLHPCNFLIYGDEDASELVEIIRDSGWVKPLVVTSNNTIISGHRRWKAVCWLGWETVPVKYREFLEQTAEIEALLLENARRFKTTEQKVRGAEAWKEVEWIKAKDRQGGCTDIRENFPRCDSECDSGRVRDQVARRVGLGSGHTYYEEAASVVRAINSLAEDIPEAVIALHKMLNEQSVDAAHQILKKYADKRVKILATIPSGQAKTTSKAIALLQQHSRERQNGQKAVQYDSEISRTCWNYQNPGQSIENNSFSCYGLGILSWLEKSANKREAECNLWSQEGESAAAENNPQTTQSTFTLTLPAHLQPLLQDTARQKGIVLVDWVTWVLDTTSLTTTQPTDKNQRQTQACRSP